MKLAGFFSDHMILQRDQPVTIWGWAEPGAPVTVEFAGQNQSTVTNPAGHWQLNLDPLPACAEPRDLRVTGQTLHNVLVGDVWLAAGQSNMDWPVARSANAATELATAQHPHLRLFHVPNRAVDTPTPDLTGAWHVCSAEAVAAFSAVAYFFGRDLQQALGVPIGLIHAAWGGTRIEAWMSRAALLTHPAAQAEIAEIDAGPGDPEFARDPSAWERRRVMADPGNLGFDRGWAAPTTDTTGWAQMRVPSKWQDSGPAGSGVFWFRREVEIPADWAGQDLALHLGACDKHDTTYFNNVPVGATGWDTPDAWCTPREYQISGARVRPGRNTIAIRVYSYMTDGGLIGPAWRMQLTPKNSTGHAPIPLTGCWQYRIEHDFGVQPAPQLPFGRGNPNTPAILFTSMIQPLTLARIRGVIWYQGESNARQANQYRSLFPLLIRDWRRAFSQGDFPFLFVQLANYTAAQQEPVEKGWAELREAQALALREPRTGMAVAIDIGDPQDIHPANKQAAGHRLALLALAREYHQPVVDSGPVCRNWTLEGAQLRLQFDHCGTGLVTRDSQAPRGFAIAGADRKFVWADVVIEGASVVVGSARVSQPVAVRYGWANNPLANLSNPAGLPAPPFRTDSWDSESTV